MPRSRTRFLLLVGLLVHGTFASVAPAQLNSESIEEAPTDRASEAPEGEGMLDLGLVAALERARSFYQSGTYDACAEAYGELFEQVGDSNAPASALEQARVHFAACLLALGQDQQADQQLREAMKANPLMASPDPVVFPARVRDLFFQVKADFLEEIRKAQEEHLRQAREEERARQERALEEQRRVQRLEELASREVLVRKNHRWVAAIPFGVGQYQNGNNALGTVFLISETLLLGATVVAVSRQLSFHAQAAGGRNVQDPQAFNDAIDTAHQIELWAGGGFFLLAGLGILEAQLSFVEEIGIGSRPRRPLANSQRRTRVEPKLTPRTGGATLGIQGTF